MAMLCKHGKTVFSDCVPCEEEHLAKSQPSPSSAAGRDEPGTVGEWMTMETAPKDDRFLAVVDGHVRIVKWGKTSHLNLFGFCLADQGVEDFDRCNPVCWMPLPLPPAQQVKS